MEKNKERIEHLIQKINEHNYQYYVLDDPTLSDKEYDKIFRELETLEQQFPQLQKNNSPTQRVGSPVKSGFKSYEHKIPMLSLANAFDEKDYYQTTREQFMNDISQFILLFERVGVDLEKEFLQTERKENLTDIDLLDPTS